MTLLCSNVTAIEQGPDRDPPDDHDDGQDVEQAGEPVAGMREGGHPLASESSQRPRVVKHTITASIQYCEFVACFGSL